MVLVSACMFLRCTPNLCVFTDVANDHSCCFSRPWVPQPVCVYRRGQRPFLLLLTTVSSSTCVCLQTWPTTILVVAHDREFLNLCVFTDVANDHSCCCSRPWVPQPVCVYRRSQRPFLLLLTTVSSSTCVCLQTWPTTILVVSHDREFLNLCVFTDVGNDHSCCLSRPWVPQSVCVYRRDQRPFFCFSRWWVPQSVCVYRRGQRPFLLFITTVSSSICVCLQTWPTTILVVSHDR